MGQFVCPLLNDQSQYHPESDFEVPERYHSVSTFEGPGREAPKNFPACRWFPSCDEDEGDDDGPPPLEYALTVEYELAAAASDVKIVGASDSF